MSRLSRANAHKAAVQKAFQVPSQLDWPDEKLAGLDTAQLKNLLGNLHTMREAGRVSEAAADDIAARITARLPARALVVKRKRLRTEVQLEARVADGLGSLATSLAQRYDLSEETARQRSATTKGFRPHALTDKRGFAKAGASVKAGAMSIDRFISYRVQDSLASLAFLLRPEQPQQTGRYVLFATDDLLEEGAPLAEFMPESKDYGWSTASRERVRALPAADFADAQTRFEAMIAKIATLLPEEVEEAA
jgi:hypothetical protein